MNDPQLGKTRVRGRKVKNINDYLHPFDYYFQLFIRAKEAEGLRSKSISSYRDHYKYFQRWLIENHIKLTLNKLTADHLRDYIQYMRTERTRFVGHPRLAKFHKEKGLAPMTIHIRANGLKAFCLFLYKEGHLQTDIGARIRVPKVNEDNVEAFTKEEMLMLLSAPKQHDFTGFRDYVLMYLLFDTGMRIGEVLQMKVEHIDFSKRIIYIPPENSKNGKPRSVPFTKKLGELITTLLQENESLFGKKSETVFLSNYGEPLKSNQAYCRIREHAESASITKKRVSPHIFRHTFSKMYILNGGDLFTLQKILGHYDLSMVRKYVQMNPNDLRAQHDINSPMANLY